jgi:Asp-tRNA(Asn)/Glu-tRNA(Gln) amidotransferase A subunit family amidase
VVLPAGVTREGLPVGVQLVGARYRDEELLALASTVDEHLGGLGLPPGWA